MESERLAGLLPLRGLSADQVEAAARVLQVRRYEAGEHLTSAGEPAPGLLVLLSGRALVSMRVDGETRDLAVLRPGAFIGELSLVTGDPATADVTARDDLEAAHCPPERGPDLLAVPGLGDEITAIARRRIATNRVAAVGPTPVDLPEGDRVWLRPMWPDDWKLMERGSDRYSTESLHKRFFSIPNPTENRLQRLATVDFVEHFAWIALDGPGEDAGLIAVARYARLHESPSRAEMAILIADDWHGHGLGQRLVVALAVAARAHGITEFEALAYAANRAVQALLERAGATWRRAGDPTHVETSWPVAATLERLGTPAIVDPLETLVRRALEDPTA